MKTLRHLTVAVVLALPGLAMAGTIDFTTTTPVVTGYNPYTTSLGSTTITNDYGNSVSFAGTVSVSAYASTGATSGTAGSVTYGSDINTQIQKAAVTQYSPGLAITSSYNNTGAAGNTYASNAYGKNDEVFGCAGNGTGCSDNAGNDGSNPNSPKYAANTDFEHAIDNVGAYEALLLSFNSKVTLANFTIGFTGGSSADTTVLYYTGAGSPTAALTSNSFASLLNSGWAVANGSQYLLDSTSAAVSVGQSAQYFLIGAYIPLGQTPVNGNTNPDYFKLKSITVPEPGSIALFGIAGGALLLGRRRRLAKAA